MKKKNVVSHYKSKTAGLLKKIFLVQDGVLRANSISANRHLTVCRCISQKRRTEGNQSAHYLTNLQDSPFLHIRKVALPPQSAHTQDKFLVPATFIYKDSHFLLLSRVPFYLLDRMLSNS